MTDVRNNLYRRSRSDDPFVALPALIRLKEIIEGPNPTTDTGFRSYGNELLPYGKGRLFLLATTNYCTNPSLEKDTNADGAADFSTNHTVTGTPTFTRPAGRTGGYAQRVQYTGVVGDSPDKALQWIVTGPAVTTGDPVTMSVYVKGSVAGATASLIMYDQGYGNLGTGYSYTITLTDTWQRVSLTGVAGAGDTGSIAILRVTGIGNGDTVDLTFDDIFVEKSAVLTPYGDGSYPGWSWSGTANASTSVRAASDIRMPTNIFSSWNVGTIAHRYVPLWTGNAGTNRSFIVVQAGGGATTQLHSYHRYDNKPTLSVAGAAFQQAAAQSWAAGTTHHNICRWSSTGSSDTQDLNHDGTNTAQGTTATGALPTLDATFQVGGVGAACGYLGPVAISPSRITDAETATFSSMLTAGDVMGVLWKLKQANCHNALFLPLLQDAKSYIVP